jgi:sugar phosphate permease
MMGRYFGRKAFGSIRGTSTMFVTPVGVVAPIYAGWVYDTTGNYIGAFILIAALLFTSAVLAATIMPPKPPAQITDVRKIM